MRSTKRTSKPSGGSTALPFVGESSSQEYLEFPLSDRNSPIKPNKQYYVEALAKDQTVGIRSKKEYPTFFKLFKLYCERRKLKLRLHMRQTQPDLWLLMSRAESDEKPDVTLEGDWREHGRYKYYARQLQQGNALSFEDQIEATKARRAWMLYTPRPERAEQICTVTKLLREKKWVVELAENS